MAALESIYALLEEATTRLNEAAHQIRDLPLEPRREHLHRIGKALSEIFDIQYHVFSLRPELTPEVFLYPFDHPEGALNVAMGHARAAEEKGAPEMAIAILRWVSTRISGEHRDKALAEIHRLERKRDA